ncbi:pentatricopeptide repeat-containing protein [Pyrus ussuriensis x Pyrus communis]|uniref:Pentatricopeptide repeat-containing protein n=1 Tax=Pyrus ussuriensis x Pyrus communis TaxID=2448454 RepID=A0A5N5HY19_9ROSA|nr:pentatricopeptide repeat-containing protein [Pyrus ussuriensis x Pyrus communis]
MPPSYEIAPPMQKCTSVTSPKQARQLHAQSLPPPRCGSRSPHLYNNVISMYRRCGSLGDSRKVFDKMPQRNLVSFNALIAAYSWDSNSAILACELFNEMGVECLRPNGSTFTSLPQASYTLEDWLIGSLIHAQVLKFGFLSDVCLQTALLGMYSNRRDLESARKVFGGMVEKDVVAWNSMIFGNLKNDETAEGLSLFDGMLRTGIVPTQFTYSMVLTACNRLRYSYPGKLIHARVINSLLDMYCNSGDTRVAFGMFKGMCNPDLVSWNTMISGCSEHGDGEKAMNLFVQLKKTSFLKPDENTFAAIISATGTDLVSNYGKSLHGQVTKAGFEKSIFVGTTLVSMYFRNVESDDAQKVFYSIKKKDFVLWTEMIMGFLRLADGESANMFFYEMCQEGHKIDSLALSGVLSACSDLVMLKQGEMIHSWAGITGHDVEMSVCGTAYSIFSQISDPDLKCWNSMLRRYNHHGMAEEALKLFSEISDQVTFLSLHSACNHSGLIEVGKFLWNCMKENGITPGSKHYSCMVSLLSRARLLDEAEELIINSPFNENLELCRTLLSSCVVYKNLKIGVHAAEQVLSLDSEDSATHILLSNLYAAAGKWDSVIESRRKITVPTSEKDPGLSWIEDKSNIQVFCSGVRSEKEVGEANAALHSLQGSMGIRDEINDRESKTGAKKAIAVHPSCFVWSVIGCLAKKPCWRRQRTKTKSGKSNCPTVSKHELYKLERFTLI